MSSGKRFKFQGSTISVVTDYTADSPPHVITAISKAVQAVVTSNAHLRSNGDVVLLQDILGMTELNDGVFVVVNKTTNTFELDGVNSLAYGTYTSGGSINVAEFSNLCELTNYNRQGGSSPEIPASSLCSDAAEFELGLPDFGTTQLSFNFAPRTAIQLALHAFYESGDKMGVKIVLPKSGGTIVQLGFIQQESEAAGVGGIWTASATIRNTGARVDLA